LLSDNYIPLSNFVARPIEEHPVGTLLLIPGWRPSPSKVCFALKLSETLHRFVGADAYLVLQGSPYGEDDEVGSIIRDVEFHSRVRSSPVFGIHSQLQIEFPPDALADQPRSTEWRDHPGTLVIGRFGMHIAARFASDRMRSGLALSPSNWAVDEQASADEPMTLIREWALRVEVDGVHRFRLPVISRQPISNNT